MNLVTGAILIEIILEKGGGPIVLVHMIDTIGREEGIHGDLGPEKEGIPVPDLEIGGHVLNDPEKGTIKNHLAPQRSRGNLVLGRVKEGSLQQKTEDHIPSLAQDQNLEREGLARSQLVQGMPAFFCV